MPRRATIGIVVAIVLCGGPGAGPISAQPQGSVEIAAMGLGVDGCHYDGTSGAFAVGLRGRTGGPLFFGGAIDLIDSGHGISACLSYLPLATYGGETVVPSAHSEYSPGVRIRAEAGLAVPIPGGREVEVAVGLGFLPTTTVYPDLAEVSTMQPWMGVGVHVPRLVYKVGLGARVGRHRVPYRYYDLGRTVVRAELTRWSPVVEVLATIALGADPGD